MPDDTHPSGDWLVLCQESPGMAPDRAQRRSHPFPDHASHGADATPEQRLAAAVADALDVSPRQLALDRRLLLRRFQLVNGLTQAQARQVASAAREIGFRVEVGSTTGTFGRWIVQLVAVLWIGLGWAVALLFPPLLLGWLLGFGPAAWWVTRGPVAIGDAFRGAAYDPDRLDLLTGSNDPIVDDITARAIALVQEARARLAAFDNGLKRVSLRDRGAAELAGQSADLAAQLHGVETQVTALLKHVSNVDDVGWLRSQLGDLGEDEDPNGPYLESLIVRLLVCARSIGLTVHGATPAATPTAALVGRMAAEVAAAQEARTEARRLQRRLARFRG